MEVRGECLHNCCADGQLMLVVMFLEMNIDVNKRVGCGMSVGVCMCVAHEMNHIE